MIRVLPLRAVRRIAARSMEFGAAVVLAVWVLDLMLGIARVRTEPDQRVDAALQGTLREEGAPTEQFANDIEHNKNLLRSASESKPETGNAGRDTDVCQTSYFAVFQASEGWYCARNPTALMAHWGPPSQSWFLASGGRFVAERSQIAAMSDCVCLAEQPTMENSRGGMWSTPIRSLLFNKQEFRITKWVCADACAGRRQGK